MIVRFVHSSYGLHTSIMLEIMKFEVPPNCLLAGVLGPSCSQFSMVIDFLDPSPRRDGFGQYGPKMVP